MHRLRVLRAAVATLLVGILAGYVLAALVGPVVGSGPLFGGTGESPEARTYMLGLLERNQDVLTALRPKRDVVSRAVEIQRSRQQGSSSVRPTSLTYLGGGGAGPANVHLYAVGVRAPDGEERLIPFALTVVGGKVVRIE
ncbi:MAG: hypothetical protein M3301_06445 [Chloroflexota bacterium]|nr:hypothetical protein [Chloroflexota bacterium]